MILRIFIEEHQLRKLSSSFPTTQTESLNYNKHLVYYFLKETPMIHKLASMNIMLKSKNLQLVKFLMCRSNTKSAQYMEGLTLSFSNIKNISILIQNYLPQLLWGMCWNFN